MAPVQLEDIYLKVKGGFQHQEDCMVRQTLNG
jgi:hypothetical protein